MADKFKLQAVLKYRKTLEEQAQQRLAELLNVEAQINQEQAEVRRQLDELSGQLRVKQQQGLQILELRLYEDQIDHHRQRCEYLRQQLTDLAELLDERRRELLFAARERKVIEKLKEKQQAETRRQLDHKERVMLDEISLRSKRGPE
jgi:flagellar FliJ protein